MAAQTAGEVGCPASEITVSQRQFTGIGGYTASWTAECRGKTFVCTSTPFDVRCAEAVPPQPK